MGKPKSMQEEWEIEFGKRWNKAVKRIKYGKVEVRKKKMIRTSSALQIWGYEK